jgi:hypothetical protein
MSDRLRRAIHEAEHGDLRPQVNPQAPVSWQPTPGEDGKALEAVLLDRLFQLARPIADASAGPQPDLRLQDAGRFFYLLEAVRNLGCTRVEETLAVILDEFLQFDARSYDELHLWCLVELSRRRPEHVRTYWPQVLSLDLQHRPATWQRPAGVALVDQPYRLTDLLFYYYVLYTLQLRPPAASFAVQAGTNLVYRTPRRPITYPLSLARCLASITGDLSEAQLDLARLALKELAALEKRRPAFGDALGLLAQPLRLEREQRRLAEEG